MGKLLPSSFYKSEDVIGLSKLLLGKYLCSQIDDQFTSGIIVETEAYRAPDDKACHAYNNHRTKRTETMFADGGVAYVYICYGIHHLFNVVTGPKDTAHAVLVRAVEPVDGIEIMMKRREMDSYKPSLTNGPGKFTRAMNIFKEKDGVSLMDKGDDLWIEDRGLCIDQKQIIEGPRVGMSTAEECSHWPWRFRIKGNKWTSKPDNVSYPHIPKY